MSQLTRVSVWDLPIRLFHWLLVIAVALAFLSSGEDSALNQWHISAGWVAGALIVFRLVWGFVGGEHSRFVDFIRPSLIGRHVAGLFRGRAERSLGHNPLGGLSVVVLLALAAVTVWTGAFGGERAKDLHELVAWTLLAFVGIHIAAVVFMSVVQRENLVTAMITGKKEVAQGAGATNAGRPTVAGIVIAIMVLAGTIYGVLQYDPQAFTLRPAEAFEKRTGTQGDIPPPQAPRGDED
jgi:cytochrome b